MIKNERVTENIVRNRLRDLGYFAENNCILVEEQGSNIATVKHLLKNASKTGKQGIGIPEFVISSIEQTDFLVIIECKADIKFHQSSNYDNPIKYAVDGVLHYSKFLSKEYNVIALAVSGQEDYHKISTFLYPKKSNSYKILSNESDKPIENLLCYQELIRYATYDKNIVRQRHNELMAFSSELHEFMRDHAKLTESEKPLLVSGTLLALKNKAFVNSYGDYKPDRLQKRWLEVICEEIENADIPNSKLDRVVQPYSSIAVHPELGKPTPKYDKGVLYELITRLNEKVWPFISVYHDFDVVGQFYGEFLKYTGGDKKALGIVLTPYHITNIFTLIANLNKTSKVLDICAGTGGFLIASMQKMINNSYTEKERQQIKSQGLVGVEQQPNMYALAASNMILRGDGKANLYQGDCFNQDIRPLSKLEKMEIMNI